LRRIIPVDEERIMIARPCFRIVVAASALLALSARVAPVHAQPATSEQADSQRIEDLVIANHILADQNILDAWGHVSIRSAKNPKHFYLSRSLAPGLVKAADIMEYDEDSKPVDPGGRALYLERFIHGEVYRARPDVQAVVHSHSPAVIPFSMTGVPLRMAFLLGAFLGSGAPVFEIRGAAGNASNMQVTDQARGAALAKRLGSAEIVLMRGHGDTVVGPTIKVAVARAVYAEANARIQMDAIRLGQPVYFTDGEAATLKKMEDEERSVIRPWELWKAQAQRRMAAP
jgi:ribulose-5-phosphate 4-epimerase/fuculose-1-phosphate aldolase